MRGLEGIAGYLRQGSKYWRSDHFPAVAAQSTTTTEALQA